MYEMIYVCIYVTRCTDSLYELDECCYRQIVFGSDCVFFYKLNADCVFYPTVTSELTSVSPLLLWTQVAMGK
jgi:hypothetical protein